MDNIRLILVILHVLITIFLIYHLHSDIECGENEPKIISTIQYISVSFRIAFYHSSCIIAIWYSRRYAAGTIRATGILLIGEFLQIFTFVIKRIVEDHPIPIPERIFDVIYVWLFLIGIVFTYKLAKQISNYHKDLMQLELLTTATHDRSMEDGGEFSLV